MSRIFPLRAQDTFSTRANYFLIWWHPNKCGRSPLLDVRMFLLTYHPSVSIHVNRFTHFKLVVNVVIAWGVFFCFYCQRLDISFLRNQLFILLLLLLNQNPTNNNRLLIGQYTPIRIYLLLWVILDSAFLHMVLNSASAAVTFTNQCFSFLIKAACLHGNLSGSCFLIERSHRRRNTAAL